MPPVKSLDDLTGRLRGLQTALLDGLVERDVPVRLALLAALAGEHILLLGPPGTAKSLVARRLHLAFADASYFERLLTRFSVPEELFGPLSIKGLEEDRYERLTQAYLPQASVAFLDEIFKANSAILNSLLTLLNEREFDNGTKRERTPLISAVGASNELPAGEELDALFDRFLLRVHVGPVSKSGFRSLLGLRGELGASVPPEVRLSTSDLAAVREALPDVGVPEDVIALLSDLREWCAAEKIVVSDRRWRKIVKLLQTSALTNGRTSVSIWDGWLLQHCVWNNPEQREKVYDWYAARAGASAAMDPARLTRIVAAWEGRLKLDEESRSQMQDYHGRLLFRGLDGVPTVSTTERAQARRGGEPLYLAPVDAHRGDPRHYNSTRIEDRTGGGKGFTRAELEVLYVASPQGTPFAHWAGRDAYLANIANWQVADLELPPAMEPTRHKAAHVEACLQEIAGLHKDVEGYQASLQAHIASLAADIRAHLWVTPDFAEPAASSLNRTCVEVSVLQARIDRVRRGFEMLPAAAAPVAGHARELGK